MAQAKSKSIGQAELRRLMQKAQTRSSSSASSSSGVGKISHKSKKYKLGSRELQLLAEQKREREAQELLQDQQRQRQPPTQSNGIPTNAQAQPKKSILKNSSTQAYAQSRAPLATGSGSLTSASVSSSAFTGFKRPADRSEPAASPAKVAKNESPPDANANQTGSEAESVDEALPEGFFDDPVLDAKARHVEYRDPGDEEWDKFQKEITQEIQGAQDLVQEDQQEATSDRQLDEIDEQMRAWHRVALLEKKMDAIEQKRGKTQLQGPASNAQSPRNGTGQGDAHNEDNRDDDDDGDDDDAVDDIDIFDWRKKC